MSRLPQPENTRPSPALPPSVARIVAEVAYLLEVSGDRLKEALATLPGEHEYGSYVTRLRAVAASHPELKAVVDQAPALAAPLRDGLLSIAQVVEDLRTGRDRLHQAGRTLSLETPGGPMDGVHQALALLGGMLDDNAVRQAELADLTISLRAVAEMTAPLVDSLSDISRAAEMLKAFPAALPPATPAPAETESEIGDWAAQILRGVRELSGAVSQGRSASPAQEQRLWESVRELHLEVVQLKGALLSAPTRRPESSEG